MAQNEAEQRILDGRIWEDFCDRLKAAGELVRHDGAPKDVENQAQGYRFLTRILRAGLESQVDYADPQYPAFFRLADETKKILNDNPDNYYQNCIIDPRFDYRITGHRGTVRWFSLGVKAGAGGPGAMASTGEIDSSQLVLDEDGRFEILVSQERKPGNWLPMTEDSGNIVVRQTFGDRRKEKRAELEIECLNPERPHNNLVPEQLEEQLERTMGFLESTVNLGLLWTDDYKAKTLNQLPLHDQVVLRAAGGDPTISYYQSHWQLAPDEALLVTISDIPECQTWNLQISNYWMESLEHRFFEVSVNKFTARYEGDGSVRILIAHEDPGSNFPNWLNTLGHSEGGMLGRIIGASDEPPERMETQLVKLADVRG
ncbi:DUF1214 domain-containing protein [Myxococcota bacterium]|nr:DUF1214 domain-containing protein [Myxococcota bacterium]